MIFPPTTLTLFALVVGIAFCAEAAIGFGATVITITLGAQLVPLDVLLPAFVPVNVALSGILVARHHRDVDWRILVRRCAPPVGLGLLAGVLVFRASAPRALLLAFAIFVVTLAIAELWSLRASSPSRPLGQPTATGLLVLGGLVHGLFGSGGPMIVYVLRRSVDDKSVFRATLAMTWLILNTALIVNFFTLGLFTTVTFTLSAVAAVPAAVALFLGEWIHRRVDARAFQFAICVLLILAGGALAARTASELAGANDTDPIRQPPRPRALAVLLRDARALGAGGSVLGRRDRRTHPLRHVHGHGAGRSLGGAR